MDLENLKSKKNIDLCIMNEDNLLYPQMPLKEFESGLRATIEQFVIKGENNIVLSCSTSSRMYEVAYIIGGIARDNPTWTGACYVLHNCRFF